MRSVIWLVALVGCSGAPLTSLGNRSFEATSVTQLGQEWPIVDTIRIDFMDDERGLHVGGFAGCNSFGGGYALRDEHLIVYELQHQLQLCTGPEGTQERLVLGLLAAEPDVDFDEDILTLASDAAVIVLL